jgi:glutamine amidotransferase
MIAVINIGVGNIKSVLMALKKIAPLEKVEVVSSKSRLVEANRVIFPGQGSMADCLSTIKSMELLTPLLEHVKEKPFLGICLGKQFLFDCSEEGNSDGLGLLSGKVIKFQKDKMKNFKVPHMGWNKINLKKNHPIFKGFDKLSNKDLYFYFVHSFFVVPKKKNVIIAETEHGVVFPSVVAVKNIVATQFHPEKSASLGLMVLKNFISWNP